MANLTVVRLDIYCSKCKKVALQSVTKIEGIDKLEIDMTKKQMTIIGDADPVCVANQLRRKFRCAELIYAGPVPLPPPPPSKEKKEDKKEGKKEEKKEAKKEEKTEEKKEEKIEIKIDEKKEEVKIEEKKTEEKSEEKKVEEKAPAPSPAPAPPPQEAAPAPQPVIIQEGNKVEHHTHCRCVGPYEPGYYQPCAYCSNRPEILWPTYNPPRAPNEVWYVWSEEKQQDPCTIS